jgi:hypothetical protein
VLQHLELDPALLKPTEATLDAPSDFAACLNARGLYSTTQFVVRLSPKIHRLIDGITPGIYAHDELDGEMVQAFSTYLHETVHWWQHIGSTAGLVLSLTSPAQAHQSIKELKTVLRLVGPKKSLKQWAEDAALAGMTIDNPALRSANIAVNNAIDLKFFTVVTLDPPSIREASRDPYFESVGHCYWMAYGHAVALLSATVDREQKYLPDVNAWDEGFSRARSAEVEGFVYGAEFRVAPLGLRALFEGQARFTQLQFLAFGVEHPPTCEEFRASGYFDGIYGEAFNAFLQITKAAWPEKIDHPIVALFLLVVDLAINPTAGFPFDIESFENFIIDADPGIRFLRLSQAARDRPTLLAAISDYSRKEYMQVAAILSEACGYDHPATALQTVEAWARDAPRIAEIMAEKETFQYGPANIVVRVLFSHFVSFCVDKLKHPEFFCWTGAWMAGRRVCETSQSLFLRYLSLFTDKADDEGIFPRHLPDKEPSALIKTLTNFYCNVMIYDLAQQWVLEEGEFAFDYAWLSTSYSGDEMTEWAKRLFHQMYGVHLDDFEIVRSPQPAS